MHDNYPHRDLLPLPSTTHPDKQERAEEMCVPEMLVIGEFNLILLWWTRMLAYTRR